MLFLDLGEPLSTTTVSRVVYSLDTAVTAFHLNHAQGTFVTNDNHINALEGSGVTLNVNWLRRAEYGNPDYIFTLVNVFGVITTAI
jgi:hypothetical protein